MTDRLQLDPEAVAWRIVEGEIIAIDLRQSTYLSVNKTGTAVWERLAEGATWAELVGVLVSRFSSVPATAELDLARFLEDLVRRGLLKEL